MKRRSVFLALGIILVMPFANGQDVAIGQWKDYLSYYQGLKVCQGGTSFYCTTTSGIFSFNTGDNSINKYNKITGLSDVGPTVARFASYNNTLFIGYSDGNIDLLQNNQVVNVPDLKNNTFVQGSKVINDAFFYNNYAYVSCGQGILQVDISLDVIQNAYYIGPAGGTLNVNGVTVSNDTMFAATDKGIYWIPMNDPNPNNYADWHKVSSGLATGKYKAITTVNNVVYTAFGNPTGRDTIYQYKNGHWLHYSYIQGTETVNALESCNGNLVLSTTAGVRLIDPYGNLIKYITGYGVNAISAYDAVADANQNLWIADYQLALVQSSASGNGVTYCPPGPFSNNVFSVTINNNNVWITPGGYDNTSYNPLFISQPGVSVEYNNSWVRLTDPSRAFFDLNSLVVDPQNPSHAFAGSFVNGVLEYNVPNFTTIYDSTEGLSPDRAAKWDRVGDLAYDTSGNLWAVNSRSSAACYLTVKKPNSSTWQAFNFYPILPTNLQSNPEIVSATRMIITQSGAKWIVLPGTGILVYQDNGTFAAPSTNNSIIITNAPKNGALPSLNIYAMAVDKDGSVWVGTDQQVVVFYSPDNVLDGLGDWDCSNVYVIQNTYTQYLMQSQVTTAIAVDGGNRKWIGTQSGGVFLMSPDGTQQIENFTPSNSPLLSLNISCISINGANGEVFFGTDQGLVSYHGTSTEGATSFGDILAFPNPVTHDYTGTIAIRGLIANADVKIADVNGDVVYHTVALGGQAVWDGNNFSGHRVKTGVYLIFCSSPDGSQSRVSKLMVIN